MKYLFNTVITTLFFSSTYSKILPLPQVIDNFIDTADSHDAKEVQPFEDYHGKSYACTQHWHNYFNDSNNTKISVMRFLPSIKNKDFFIKLSKSQQQEQKDHFIITPGNLHYDASIPTSNTHIPPNQIDYIFDGGLVNLNSMPLLQFNFLNISKDFKVKIQLQADLSIGTLENISFTNKNLNPFVDLTHINWESGNPIDNLSHIHRMSFTINSDNIPGVTCDLTSIEAVPEPFSMIILTPGIINAIKKRKKLLKVS